MIRDGGGEMARLFGVVLVMASSAATTMFAQSGSDSAELQIAAAIANAEVACASGGDCATAVDVAIQSIFATAATSRLKASALADLVEKAVDVLPNGDASSVFGEVLGKVIDATAELIEGSSGEELAAAYVELQIGLDRLSNIVSSNVDEESTSLMDFTQELIAQIARSPLSAADRVQGVNEVSASAIRSLSATTSSSSYLEIISELTGLAITVTAEIVESSPAEDQVVVREAAALGAGTLSSELRSASASRPELEVFLSELVSIVEDSVEPPVTPVIDFIETPVASAS